MRGDAKLVRQEPTTRALRETEKKQGGERGGGVGRERGGVANGASVGCFQGCHLFQVTGFSTRLFPSSLLHPTPSPPLLAPCHPRGITSFSRAICSSCLALARAASSFSLAASFCRFTSSSVASRSCVRVCVREWECVCVCVCACDRFQVTPASPPLTESPT